MRIISDQAKLADVEQVPFFEDLGPEAIADLAACMELWQYEKDETVFLEGDVGDSFYIVKNGQVEIVKSSEASTGQAELVVAAPGDAFGEMSLFDHEPRSATVRALTTTQLYRLAKDPFLKLCQRHPAILAGLVRVMSIRLRHTNARFIKLWDSLWKRSKLEAIGTAASRIVHDIKNPLTVIVLAAQMLEVQHPDAETYTAKIIQQTQILNNMVQDILDFAKGRTSCVEMRSHNLADILVDLHDELAPIAQRDGVMFTIKNTVAEPVYMDAFRIERSLTNIVVNAIEALSLGGKIELSSFLENDQLVFLVKDNGPGINQDIMDTLFEPFITTGKVRGTGLGLAICKKTIEDHHGSITVQNLPAGGACFTINLPYKK